MADITLSPIPYNNGTMVLTRNANHVCQLTPTKFLHVVAQTAPGYVYAYVANYSNIKSGSYGISSTGPMRAVLSGTNAAQGAVSYTSIRVFRISDTYAALVVGLSDSATNVKMYILEVNGTDGVSLVGTPLTSGVFSSNNSSPSMVNNFYGFNSQTSSFVTGSFWQVFNTEDNVLYVADRATMFSNQINVKLRRLVFNPSTKSFTVSDVADYQQTGGTNVNTQSFTRFYMQSIPGSTSKLFSIRLHATTNNGAGRMDSAVIVYAAIISQAGAVTRTIGTLPNTLNVLCPLTPTTVLGFSNSRAYYTWSSASNTWSGPCIFNAAGGNPVLDAVALDANYFLLFSGANDINGDIGGNGYGRGAVRIGRFIDATFGQTSTATQGSNGVALLGGPEMYADQQILIQNGTDAMYIYGRGSSSNLTPQMRVIHQPGA